MLCVTVSISVLFRKHYTTMTSEYYEAKSYAQSSCINIKKA